MMLKEWFGKHREKEQGNKMTVKELFEKYCEKLGENEYVVHGACRKLCPATEPELEAFKNMCEEYHVEQRIMEELLDYYRQTNSFFGYHKCDDESLFEWWEDDEQRSIWLGNLNMDCFIYDDLDHKYGIGYAGDKELGAYDTVMEMLEAYLKEGYENGING